jgi:RNA polymerase sigma-70 factor (ECF subfamily)
LEGDNASFDALVRSYQKQVYCFCYRMLGSPEESADAAQESFIKAYYALASFRQDARFATWLLKIASNACIDRSRARARSTSLALEELADEAAALRSDEPTPEESVLRSESDRMVREAILCLPAKRRAALVMFHFSGLGIKEISEALGRPQNTIKSDLRVAREMLRRKLEGVVR